eukprot:Lithocolla_globosa_v1_NODE_20_length_9637_cov_33.687643.p3 type:complete len:279 gc:universal NODE_20_length_9637_cov_33.687643:8356-7520(-)
MSKQLTKRVINNVKVKPIHGVEKTPINMIKGNEYFDIEYPNLFTCSKKNSGKTTVVFNILKAKCDKKQTKVVVFCGTHQQDDSWIFIRNYLEAKGFDYEFYYSIYEDNALANTIEEMKQGRIQDEQEKEEDEEEEPCICDFGEQRISVKIKKKKPKLIAPKFFLVFDDLARELRDKDISLLTRENRHYRSFCIFSSQVLNDIHPDALIQMSYVLIFQGINLIKLEELYKKTSLSTTFDKFVSLYNDATQYGKYNFFYVDITNTKFRKNFNLKYDNVEE